MKYVNAIQRIKLGQGKYALTGGEDYLKESFIDSARPVFVDSGVNRFTPENQTEALDVLKSGSLFETGLVILSDFDHMKVKAFAPLITIYSECLIILLSPGANLKNKDITQALSGVEVVACAKLRPYGNDYPIWIKTQIMEMGFESESKVEDEVYRRTGPNLFIIHNELKKLGLIKSEDDCITLKDVKDYISMTSSSTVFELFDCLMKQDIKKALYCFDSYSKDKKAFNDLIAFFGTILERLYRVLLLQEAKFSISDIANIVGVPKFILQTKYFPQARFWGKSGLSKKLGALCDLDVKLRLFRGDKKLIVEKFLHCFSEK